MITWPETAGLYALVWFVFTYAHWILRKESVPSEDWGTWRNRYGHLSWREYLNRKHVEPQDDVIEKKKDELIVQAFTEAERRRGMEPVDPEKVQSIINQTIAFSAIEGGLFNPAVDVKVALAAKLKHELPWAENVEFFRRPELNDEAYMKISGNGRTYTTDLRVS